MVCIHIPIDANRQVVTQHWQQGDFHSALRLDAQCLHAHQRSALLHFREGDNVGGHVDVKPLVLHKVHAQQQLLVACKFIKDVHAVNNLLAFEAKRRFAELVRVHVFTRRSCQHSRAM